MDWEWQAADGAMGKARFGGIGPNPTDRGKAGSKRSLLWKDRRPIEHCGAGANAHDDVVG